MLKGLILDMDGTLLDSHDFHLEAWKLLLKKYNIKKTDSDILSQFGKTTEDIARNLFPAGHDPVQIGAEKDDFFLTLVSDICLFSGVSEVISRLKRQNYKICVASSNPFITVHTICTNCDLEIDACIGVDEIEHGKPAPDMILAAASRLGLAPSECLVVGDSPYDIRAAKAAKCRIIAVLTGGHSLESLQKEGPDFILQSITEIEDILEKLT